MATRDKKGVAWERAIPTKKDSVLWVTIYEPGGWMTGTRVESTEFKVFVGGCGVGNMPTLESAIHYARMRVVGYFERDMDEAISKLKWAIKWLTVMGPEGEGLDSFEPTEEMVESMNKR